MSSVLLLFVTNPFPFFVESLFRISTFGRLFHAKTIDTAGQEEWHHLLDDYILSGQGFALVYSIVEQPSFTEIRSFYEKIERLKDDASIPLVICGNKKVLFFLGLTFLQKFYKSLFSKE